MSDFLFFIQSINKIAIITFFMTSILVIFEIYLLIKEKKTQEKPLIPEFKTDKKYKKYEKIKPVLVIKKEEEKRVYQKPNLKLTVIFIIFMFFSGIIFLLGKLTFNQPSKNQLKINPTPMVKTVSSPGIKIYNENWEEISEEKLSSLKPGDKIFIGIKTIIGVDIDKARIKINSDKWMPEDEVANFNQKLNLFYKEYQIATDESQLKIEAQLHSQKEGWLGE